MPLISTPSLSFIDVAGHDASRVANNLCTAPLLQLSGQTGYEAFFTDIRGKTLGHFCVFATDEGLRLIGAANQADKIAAHFDRYTIREDAVVTDRSDESTGFLIDLQTLSQVEPEIDFGQPPSPNLLAYRRLSTSEDGGEIAAYQVPWLGMNELVGGGLGGQPAVLIAGSTTAIRQWLVRCQPILQAMDAEMLDVSQFHALRVKAGFPWYGIDLDDKNLPQELDRDAMAISFTKGCYLGQETVARLDALGQVQKKLVLWQVNSAKCPPVDTQLTVGENVVGRLTSVTDGDRPDQWLALGYARRTHFETGSTAQWKGEGDAVVQPSGFVK